MQLVPLGTVETLDPVVGLELVAVLEQLVLPDALVIQVITDITVTLTDLSVSRVKLKLHPFDLLSIFTPPQYWSGVGPIAISLSVCLSASISLEPLDRPSQNFYAGPLWPWRGLRLAALRHVMYFRFYG